MDPNVNLAEQLQIAARINSCRDAANMGGEHQGVRGHSVCQCVDDAERLAELVEALDEWMSKGGFKPCRWS